MTTPRSRSPVDAPRSTRADARRNYDRLVAAASTVFAEQGADASLEEIARRAGLGSATLHRHFRSRYDLLEAVFRERIDTLCTSGRELLNAPSPGEALVTWLRSLIVVAAERGLATALVSSTHDRAAPLFEASHEAIRATGAPLLVRAQQSGEVRPDIELGDLHQVANAIALTIEHDPEVRDRVDRLLDLLVEGIRTHSPSADSTLRQRDAHTMVPWSDASVGRGTC